MSRAADLLYLSDYAGGGAAAGGAGLAVRDSLAALDAAGYAARLIAGFGDEGPNVRICGGDDLRDAGGLARLRTVHNASARRLLEPLLADHDPEDTVIVLHQWTRWLSPAAIAALRAYRMVVVMHDYFWVCPTGAHYHFGRQEPCERTPLGPGCLGSRCDRAGTGHKLVRIARGAALRQATQPRRHDILFAHVSEASRRRAEPLLRGGRHAVLYNPFSRSSRRAGARAHSYDVGYFGRLEPEKGIAELVAALAAQGRSGLFVGAGSLAPLIAATPGMTLLDWQEPERTPGLMRLCRVVALPSLWPETWGLVTAEAMIAGVPVLVSSRAGSAELVARFGGGVVFDPGDPAALPAAIDRLDNMTPLADASALADLLSPARHADTLARAIGDAWGVSLSRGSRDREAEAVANGPARRSPMPAVSPPPPM